MQNLKLNLVQANLLWEQKEKNLELLESMVLRPPNAHLYVLPEMFSTGFSMRSKELAEDASNSRTLDWMQSLAKKTGAVLCGSFIVKDNGYFNRFYAVNGYDIVSQYDKRHLFRMAQEDLHYDAGTALSSWRMESWKINPFICYDLRFPVWSRNKGGIDLKLP